MGVTFLEIKGRNGRRIRTTKQMVYCVEEMDYCLLSQEACKNLVIIGSDFPAIGSYGDNEVLKLLVDDKTCHHHP